ncbi:MAG: response regulator, partial [Solirubrobacteraceae bacterium]
MTTTVLIVDDHPSFRAIARAVLADGGYAVVGEAADARSALAAVREIRPDCVLLDVQLGDVDGFAVAEALAGERDAPAVVFTSGRDRRDLEPMIRA